MKNKMNIFSIILSLSIFILPFLFILLLVSNNNPLFSNSINMLLIVLLIVFIVLFIISLIMLFKNDKLKNRKYVLKKISLAMFSIFFLLEGLGIVSIVYYNNDFKSWIINTSLKSINYQNITKYIYKDEEISKYLVKNEVDLSKDIISLDDVKVENEIYADEFEREILDRNEDELYKIIKVSGTVIGSKRHYEGIMVVVYDPANVTLGLSTGMEKNGKNNVYAYGEQLKKISKNYNAILAMNAGGFHDPRFRSNGGIPHGVVVANGQVYKGYKVSPNYSEGMIGFTTDNKLVLKKNMGYEEAKNFNYRDAVDFGPFLIVDGKNRYKKVTKYSWATSRTAIGQRADGVVLLLVIDGLQSFSAGASFADEAAIMEKYGAINAANLDGGTSTSLTLNNKYINSPWNGKKPTFRYLPNAWIVTDNSK